MRMLSGLKNFITFFKSNKEEIYTALVIFLVGLGGFGLGRLSLLWPPKEPIRIIENRSYQNASSTSSLSPSLPNFRTADHSPGRYVASKSGGYYHFPWCPGAQKIKEANRIWFNTREEAEGRGLKPAVNCPGL